MSWVSIAAIFFIIWWLVLFATLPFGLKSQDDDQDVTLGTVSSAPKGPHILRAISGGCELPRLDRILPRL